MKTLKGIASTFTAFLAVMLFFSAQGVAQTTVPDIKLLSTDGETEYELHKVMKEHKLVLIDFWASWCGPCRHENPYVVKTYDEFKDKGFTVFSVSLDSRADRWKKAIEKDKLAWKYHVSDLKGWDSAPAAEYGVRSIPSNFLINSKGEVLGYNLRGNNLSVAVKKALAEVKK
ncbi:hypothetical protein FUAX_22440 [Fulvitalea axinellae]|uniref:Thioredoxin domain-containing protein n=1 Tax=Fulvitalea axinellae TaxID=1182444 RepID=A0AAU9CS66_9BACT|nr:hypothetical protein FUAX_22440 [Fulvitalea axinellae]